MSRMRTKFVAGACFAGVAGLLAMGAVVLGACISSLHAGPDGRADGASGDSGSADSPVVDAISGDSGEPGDGGNAACAAYAAAECTFLARCEPGVLQVDHGTEAKCVQHITAACEFNVTAPGTGVTASYLAACTPTLTTKANACASGPVPLAVPSLSDPCNLVGAGMPGAPCGFDVQCQTGLCVLTGGVCGTCAPAAALGEVCGPTIPCANGLVCSSKNGLCATPVPVSASCDFDVTTVCVAGANCVSADAGATSGTCLAAGAKVGMACNTKSVGAPPCSSLAGFFCDPTGQCAAISYVPTGATCGVSGDGGVDSVCTNFDECLSGKCTAPIATGASCAVGGEPTCAGVSVCVAGDGGAPAVCTAPGLDCMAASSFPFQPSNVAMADVTSRQGKAKAEDVAGPCTVKTDTSSPNTDCFTSPIVVVTQPDGSRANLVVVESLRVEAAGAIRATGSVPLILVSLGDVTIVGSIDAHSTDLAYGPGGAQPAASGAKGLGTGGGPAASASATVGGGGGSYCGLGGAGGGATQQGKSYGAADNRPLAGGASGGGGTVGSGAGGGAVQIVAAGTLTVQAGGAVTVGGQGGPSGGAAPDQNGGGGGSGGAILLEGSSVVMGGTLAANGGGGGGGANGKDATASATAASGGGGNANAAAGGAGGAAATVSGGPGSPGSGTGINTINAGGGGGGAGWVRINTSSGTPTVTGAISPSAAGCSSTGQVRAAGTSP